MTMLTWQPLPVAQVGELVEHDELVIAGGDDVGCNRPRLGGACLVAGEVVGVPGEPVAEGVPVDAELAPDLLLADLPVAALDELHDGDLPAAGDGAQHGAEGRRALALAVAGVDEEERVDVAQLGGARVLGRRGRGVRHGWGL
jgi:hypothetical protein